jgi:hypothetical protein
LTSKFGLENISLAMSISKRITAYFLGVLIGVGLSILVLMIYLFSENRSLDSQESEVAFFFMYGILEFIFFGMGISHFLMNLKFKRTVLVITSIPLLIFLYVIFSALISSINSDKQIIDSAKGLEQKLESQCNQDGYFPSRADGTSNYVGSKCNPEDAEMCKDTSIYYTLVTKGINPPGVLSDTDGPSYGWDYRIDLKCEK